MKRILIALLLVVFFTGITSAQDPVRYCSWEVLTLAETDSTDSSLVYFPTQFTMGKPILNGYVTVLIQPVNVDESAEDSLSITAKTIYRDKDGTVAVNQAETITIVSYLDWTDTFLYGYPVLVDFGVCEGLCLYGVYNGAAAADSIEVSVTLIIQ